MNQPNKQPLPDVVRQRLAEWGRRGGKSRAAKLSKKRKREIAQMGHQAQVKSIAGEQKPI